MDTFLKGLSTNNLNQLRSLIDVELANRYLVEPTLQEREWLTGSTGYVRKIDAIKSVRTRLGITLGPAKWTVEEWMRNGFKAIPIQNNPLY